MSPMTDTDRTAAEIAAGLDSHWGDNLVRLCRDEPVLGTGELTRLGLVRWTRNAVGWCEVTPLGREVAAELERSR